MRTSPAPLAAALILAVMAAGRAAEIVTPSSVPITQTVVALGAGQDVILGSNRNRRYLCLLNIGTGLVTLGFDGAAVAGSGWALEGATADGHQGGSMCWESSTVAGSVVHAVSDTGSTVSVLEGH